MKRVISKLWILSALTITVVSFQNCGKLQPGITIDDQLISNGLNTDELPQGADVVVDIGEAPQDLPMQMDQGQDPVQTSTPGTTTTIPGGTQMQPPTQATPPAPAPVVAATPTTSSQPPKGGSCDKNKKHEDESSKEDVAVCLNKKQGLGHQIVHLSKMDPSYDGANDQSHGTTYIFAESGTVVEEIKNTQGKTVICSTTVKKISNNVGSLVMYNSFADQLDGKKGNVVLINSTINHVANMKGVIKK